MSRNSDETDVSSDCSPGKARKVDYMTRARGDMSYLIQASGFIRCDHCKEKLGILRCMRFALFKKKGSIYIVPCQSCGFLNERTKGGLATEFNKRWE